MSTQGPRGRGTPDTGPPEAVEGSAIDRDRWADLAEFDTYEPGTVAGLVESFAAHAPVRLTALEAVAAEGDLHEVERLAHALRGTAGNLGAARTAAALATIEIDAAAGRGPAVDAVEQVRLLADEAVAEARRLLR